MWKSKWTHRTITIIGDENDFRYFVFDDYPQTITQCRLDIWNDIFEEI